MGVGDWWLAGVGGWQLVGVGGWRLAVGGWWSPGAVLKFFLQAFYKLIIRPAWHGSGPGLLLTTRHHWGGGGGGGPTPPTPPWIPPAPPHPPEKEPCPGPLPLPEARWSVCGCAGVRARCCLCGRVVTRDAVLGCGRPLMAVCSQTAAEPGSTSERSRCQTADSLSQWGSASATTTPDSSPPFHSRPHGASSSPSAMSHASPCSAAPSAEGTISCATLALSWWAGIGAQEKQWA